MSRRPFTGISPWRLQSPTEPHVIERLAREAWRKRAGVWLSAETLKRLPEYSRELIESEARRLYGERD